MGFLNDLFGTSNKFNATATPLQQTNFAPAIDAALGQPGQVMAQQNELAKALQAQMNGQGPNLAQTQLQAGLDQNNQRAAGVIAGQRGLNPQLAAREILQNNANNTQGAANAAAQLQQSQQLNATSQLGNVLAQQGQLGVNQIGTLGGLQNQQNSTNVQQNLGVQGINSGVAEFNAKNNAGTLGGAAQAGIKIASMLAHGGEVADTVPALVSPGEMIIPPGGSAADGGIVPGQAAVPGDSLKNDTVPAALPEGSMVIPRSVMAENKLNPRRVEEFMAAIRNEKPKGYGKVADAKKKLQRR